MSTSDPTQVSAAAPETSNWANGLQGGERLTPGVLSPAELARMANEMFNALPDSLQQSAMTAASVVLPPNSALSGNPYAAVPGPTAPAVPVLLTEVTETQLPVFASTQNRGVPVGVPPAAISPASTAVPTDLSVSGVTSSSAPGFSFLEDTRPIVNESAPKPAGLSSPAQTSGSAIPNDEGFAAIPYSLFTDVQSSGCSPSPQPSASAIPAFSFLEEARPLFSSSPKIPGPIPAKPPNAKENSNNPFAAPRDFNAPQLAGTVAHQPDFRAPAFSELSSQSRPLDPGNVVPIVLPGAGQSELSNDLGLSSYSFDVETIRRDFPILQEQVNGYPLIWFDNGATTQKPQSVIDRLSYFYEHENSNVHRAAHELAARATDAYESAREKTRRFLNAGSAREIVFVRGATEAINLVAQSWGRRNIQKDDEIVITWLEHHANIVPWQMLCGEKGARLRVAPVDDSGQILLDEYEKLLGPKTRLVSVAHVSNALGTILPVTQMVESAHRHGARVLVDGAQAVSHMRVDVQAINCDFYVFSGHKVFAPTGIGVVYGKPDVLENMPPWQGGGNMIQDVTFEKTLYQPPPQRFEAGTGNIADAIGLGAAIDYLDRVSIANVSRHEHVLLTYATEALNRIPGLHIIGTAKEKASVISFVMDGFRTEEIGDYLNRKGIAVRGGHHCAQPILRRFGVETTLRATFALYNTCEEVDALVAALWDLRQGSGPRPI